MRSIIFSIFTGLYLFSSLTLASSWETHQINQMTYFLAEPNVYDTSQKYPVVVSLHGSGGNGQNSMGQRFLTDSDHNAWVIAPTSPENTVLSQTSHQS